MHDDASRVLAAAVLAQAVDDAYSKPRPVSNGGPSAQERATARELFRDGTDPMLVFWAGALDQDPVALAEAVRRRGRQALREQGKYRRRQEAAG